jgi:hypothetical protein
MHNIKTPHAAVIVWNYKDRIGTPTGDFKSSGVEDSFGLDSNDTSPTIISTLSCVSIQTSKSKGQPEGNFTLVLAPTKNWVSTLTAGSWCVIMMSNEPIKAEDLKHANKNHVKMLGRIESVRCETSIDDSGTRKTLYYVSGIDWGHIFSSILYVDPLLLSPGEKINQGNSVAVAIRDSLFGKKGTIASKPVKNILADLLGIMGINLAGFNALGETIGRLGNTVYELTMPDDLLDFFNFTHEDGKKIDAKTVNKIITLITGSLTSEDKYYDFVEALGFIDPFSLQGANTLWQMLLENSNPALNEMLCDMYWNDDSSVQLRLYNRIKPFSYKNFNKSFDKINGEADRIKSYFQYLKTHKLNSVDIMSVNAGSNWRDKVNFIEVKPQFQEFNIVANWTKQRAQVFDREAFDREGFRSMIVETKQFPGKQGSPAESNINFDSLAEWGKLLREWFFGTHRMLNGTIVLHGSTEYIGIGNNIKFDAGLLNPNVNINEATKSLGKNKFILAHIESISHSFNVTSDGARTYRTSIQFVRGIIVDENNKNVGDGVLDQDVTKLSESDDNNSSNTNSISGSQDPNRGK